MRAWQGAIGVARNEGMVSPAYISAIPNGSIFPEYMDYCLCRKCIINQINNLSYGVTDFRKRLYWEPFTRVTIMMPSLDEQRKITDVLSRLDHLITLHQRKLEKLKIIKKSMLENCFPKNGEKAPKIRFSGFSDDWEQRKFSDLVLIERGGSPRPIDAFITDNPNGLNWVKIGDAPEQGRYITKTAEKIRPEGLSKTREVHPGDLILSNSMSFGKPYIMGVDGCIHDGWLLIRDTQKRFDLKFLCHMLGTDQMLNQYRAFAAGSTVNNLNKELVGNTTVTIPSLEEQQVLGQYFENLDHLITLHQKKCFEWKKRGFSRASISWEQRKFEEAFIERREKTEQENEDILLSCAINGMFLNSELFGHFRGTTTIGYLRVKKNDLILSAQNLHLGNANVNLRFEHGIISPAYKVYDLNNCNPEFVQSWVKRDDTKNFFLAATTEGASQCRKNIEWETLGKQTIPMPSMDEQKQVGAFFSQLDHLITLHQRKLELLKRLRKSLVDRCFIGEKYTMSKLILYHGSPNRVIVPKFGFGEDRHDYGRGFYLTENLELAKEWAVCRLESECVVF